MRVIAPVTTDLFYHRLGLHPHELGGRVPHRQTQAEVVVVIAVLKVLHFHPFRDFLVVQEETGGTCIGDAIIQVLLSSRSLIIWRCLSLRVFNTFNSFIRSTVYSSEKVLPKFNFTLLLNKC